MNGLRYIRYTLLLLSVLFWRCSDDPEIDIPAQREAFQKYMESLTESPDATLLRDHNLFRIVPWPGQEGAKRVAGGNAVTIEYTGYLFSASGTLGYGRGNLFATNNPTLAVESGLVEDPVVLPPENLTFRQGAGEVLRGIDLGVEGAALADTLLLYLTSDLAYGEQSVGFLEVGTPVVFEVIIKEINE
ncbi:MAG: FKBP-type peptidyl-prolyl cis-trans isomerase [Rikenellaceae bacterium]|jgi:FKBP-type peptidyl-prolyl cis-trans isomerase|nr:FKBP-type peptidyl-prolyl cis-trans isomerase [Rikenellaceae bacterium]